MGKTIRQQLQTIILSLLAKKIIYKRMNIYNKVMNDEIKRI